ncbi:glutamine amidotransferase class-I [Colletotrichum tabaci]|uniref:Glutamine amidotransferase class-I n=1 Tax=Colletotrichum tabaci TaxID=1209068 RepID=A0AAV9TCL4_9PEZI
MAFRVAILANFEPDEQGGSEMLSRITTLLRCSRTGATEITIHAAIRGDAFPDPSEYDLVILTGGPFNLLKHTEENERPEWVRRTLGWVQETDIQKNHALVVTHPGPYLTPVASGSSSSQNEVLLSHSPPILTFQGHPEMDAALARLFAGFATGGASDRADWIPSEGLKGIDDVHDGEAILRRVVAWAGE